MKTTQVRRAIHRIGRGGAPALIALLDRQLAEASAACGLARSVAEGRLVASDALEQIGEIEHRGDLLRGKLVNQLAGVLVTPVDREDLFRLSRSIDDVLDNLRDFVREWDLYKIEATDACLGLIDATASGLQDLRQAVQTISRDPKETSQFALVCKKSANEVRRQYEAELGRLFDGELNMEVIKAREVLRRLDVVGLRLNEAADVLSDAAVKRRA